MKVITTNDGSQTLFNEEFNEAYHSTKAGAFTESLYKFVIPCHIESLVKSQKVVRILDVGFGLAYNVATAIYVARKTESNAVLEIYSIEKDKNILQKISLLEFPKELKSIYGEILKGKQKGNHYISCGKNFRLKVIFGEGRQIIKGLRLKFDAVFFDPFSPKVNTEMWTVQLFKKIKQIMKPKAVLATYSASLAVRKGLIEAGFKIGLVEPVGRKSYSTVATIEGEIPPLTEKEKTRLENSPFAVCYEDNEELTLPRDVIKQNWEEKVKRQNAKV